MFRNFFGKKTNPSVQRLYDRVVAQARSPIFYQRFDVPDTLEGRFDMIVLHLTPLVDAMRSEDGAITDDGQALFDTFVADMEQNLRTIGVGDTSVPKKMKAFGKAFYGRFNAYRSARADEAALNEAIARNVLDNAGMAGSVVATSLTAYLSALWAHAEQSDPLADFAFPSPEAFAPGANPVAERTE